MKSRTKLNSRFLIVLMISISISILLCSCQPAPETPPVVQRTADIPVTAPVQDTVYETDTADYFEPPEYESMEYWKETIEPSKKVTIHADTDILIPKVAAYPIEKLEKVSFPIEKVLELEKYFVKDDVKYFKDMSYVMTKSDYEKEIVQVRKNITDVENGADGEDPAFLREYIKELEKKLAEAPETIPDDVYVDIPAFDDDGLWLSFQYPDGTKTGGISAKRDHGRFLYIRRKIGDAGWESMARINSTPDSDPRVRPISLANLEKMLQNKMNKEDALDKAIKILKDLGIKDMQFNAIETVLLGDEKYDEYALSVRFARECGGIPSTHKTSESRRKDEKPPEYSLPFYIEEIEIVISENGTVEYFSWDNAAQVMETVTNDAQVLPIEQIKQRIVNQLYYKNSYIDENTDFSSCHLNIDIQKIELKTTYINIRDELDHALIVPIWFISYTTTLIDKDFSSGEQQEQMMINALDGGVITMMEI